MRKEMNLFLFVAASLIAILAFVSAIPLISFVSPTPTNEATTTNTSFIVNVSIAESDLGDLIWNFNNTNYTIYNNSLLLMMNFDNISAIGENSTRIVDLSRYQNNGTAINGSSYNATGKYNGAYQFDGINDYITVPLVTNKVANVTISAWFKTNKYNQSGQMIVYVGSDANANGYGFAVNSETDTDGTFRVLYGGVLWHITGVRITDSNWHHGVLVINSTGKPNLYLDGIFVYGLGSATSPNAPTLHTEIGRNNYAAARYFNGSIDEVRVWNRTLSAAEIYQQYVSNLQKFNSTQWYLYVNQSKNASDGLDFGNYSYQVFTKDLAGNSNQTELRTMSIIPITLPQILLNWIYPTTDINVSKNQFFNVSINVSCSGGNCGEVNVSLDPASIVYTFTTCGASGRLGPNQTRCNTNYSGTSLAGLVTVGNGTLDNGTQYWTVPTTGAYTIETYGAQGGGPYGGKGAYMKGTFNLNSGTILKIVVGQKGQTHGIISSTNLTSGGGGTYVVNGSYLYPLIISGGGGGASLNIQSVTGGQNGTAGKYGLGGNENGTAGGTNGFGGIGTGGGGGGGGGGGLYNSATGGSGAGYGFANGSYEYYWRFLIQLFSWRV